MQLSRREGVLAITFAVFLIIYCFYLYLYNPLIVKTGNLIEENNELIMISLVIDKAESRKDSDNEDRPRQAFAKFNEKLPEGPYLPETIKFIEELSKENNLELLMTQYGLGEEIFNNKGAGECQECLFEIDVMGSYLDLTKFIRGIENAIRLYNIESISMTMEQMTATNFELMGEASVYNPQAIIMKVIFKSYYDNISWEVTEEIKVITHDNVTPSNPFIAKEY